MQLAMESLGLLASSSSLSQAAMSAAVPDAEVGDEDDTEWRRGTDVPFIVINGNIVGLQYYSGQVSFKIFS